MESVDEDDSSVPLIGRDAVTSIHGVELPLGGAIDGFAIYGAGVFAGHKYESYASDGMFLNGDASVGGDNDEKYEDDFSLGVFFFGCALERCVSQRPPGGR